jgi:hypothetical protein
MRILFIFSIACLLQASSCRRSKDECPATFLNKSDDRLTIVNNSVENINFIFSYEYPDDSTYLHVFVPTEQSMNANPAFNVGPNSSKKFTAGSCWESRFRQLIPSGKLRILIFNIDSVKVYPAAEIISRGLYKSYLYTLDELKAVDWQVVYP